jgi:hypothetical protein
MDILLQSKQNYMLYGSLALFVVIYQQRLYPFPGNQLFPLTKLH